MACRKFQAVGPSEARARSLAHHAKCFACKAAIFHRQDGLPTQRPLGHGARVLENLQEIPASRDLPVASIDLSYLLRS